MLLSIYVFIYVSIYVSIYLFVYLFVYLFFIYLSVPAGLVTYFSFQVWLDGFLADIIVVIIVIIVVIIILLLLLLLFVFFFHIYILRSKIPHGLSSNVIEKGNHKPTSSHEVDNLRSSHLTSARDSKNEESEAWMRFYTKSPTSLRSLYNPGLGLVKIHIFGILKL